MSEWHGVVIRTGPNSAQHGWYRALDGRLEIAGFQHDPESGSNIGAQIASADLRLDDDPREIAKAILRSHTLLDRNSFSDPWIHKWQDPGII